jgi:hypothetical protein
MAMKKILLAVNGMNPSHKLFSYTVQLCQRLKAELCVLQVIEPSNYGVYFRKIGKKAGRAKNFLEDSMTAVTFAESGDHDTARAMMIQGRKNINELLPETAKAGVLCSVTTKSGQPGNEIVRYARQHRDVVLTVYDGADAEEKNPKPLSKRQDIVGKIKQYLQTPMVTIHG